MAEVLRFTGTTILPEPASGVLEKAKDWNLSRVVILGFTENGAFVFGGSHSEIAETVLLLEIAKKRLIAEADHD